MKKAFHIHLRAGERIFVNGAVMRADRKVSLEFLNDVDFLLEAHVMQADATTTPLRQLYFIVQTILMDPFNAAPVQRLFREHYAALMGVLETKSLRDSLEPLPGLVESGSTFEALKLLRGLFAVEAEILGITSQPLPLRAKPLKEAASCR